MHYVEETCWRCVWGMEFKGAYNMVWLFCEWGPFLLIKETTTNLTFFSFVKGVHVNLDLSKLVFIVVSNITQFRTKGQCIMLLGTCYHKWTNEETNNTTSKTHSQWNECLGALPTPWIKKVDKSSTKESPIYFIIFTNWILRFLGN